MKRKLFLPICIGVLMLLLSVIGFFDLLGYAFIEGAAVYLLFGLLIALALGGAALWLTRRMKRPGLRILVGTLSTLVVCGAVMLMFFFFTFVNNFYTPKLYTVLESEGGRKVAVMRSLSQEHAAQRMQARGGSELSYEDLGYQYQIYPVFSKFFYNSKAAGEGSLEIGCESDAVLMHRWMGDSLEMYIDQPEAYDSGTLVLH